MPRDGDARATVVTHDGDGFTYASCVGAPAPVRFTVAALAGCPPAQS